MAWQRQTLVKLAGGHDAVVQVSEKIVEKYAAVQLRPTTAFEAPPRNNRRLQVGEIVQMFPPTGRKYIVTGARSGAHLTSRCQLTIISPSNVTLSGDKEPYLELNTDVLLAWSLVAVGYDFSAQDSGPVRAPDAPDDASGSGSPSAGAGIGRDTLGSVDTASIRVAASDFLISASIAPGHLQLKAALAVALHPTAGVISIFADPTSAKIKLDAQDEDAAHLLGSAADAIAKGILSNAGATAGVLPVVPDISLVGTLMDRSPIPEIQVSSIELRKIGPASEGIGACLSVAIALAGTNRGQEAQVSNFLAADQYASLISNRMIAAICRYRWRTGDYPRTQGWGLMQASYGDNAIPILVYWLVSQKDMIDENGNVLATTRVAGTYGYDPLKDGKITYRSPSGATDRLIPEDHFLTGGHISITVEQVVHRDNSDPVPAEVIKQLTVPDEFKNLIAHWPFRLASVVPPAPLPDSNMDRHVTAMRQGVSGHLSRPFARAITGALSRRLVNGAEGYILSGGELNV